MSHRRSRTTFCAGCWCGEVSFPDAAAGKGAGSRQHEWRRDAKIERGAGGSLNRARRDVAGSVPIAVKLFTIEWRAGAQRVGIGAPCRPAQQMLLYRKACIRSRMLRNALQEQRRFKRCRARIGCIELPDR
jgi:hypothetical protein